MGLTRPADLTRWTAALIVGAPVIVAVLGGVLLGGGDAWQHVVETRLATYSVNTILTLCLVATLCLITAVPAAWLVTTAQFPGRSVFDWALVLPLAAPGYVVAFAYADLFGVAGPLQSALREATGLSARDYWFPSMSSLPGLAFVLSAGLFPYVYLTARAAFTSQSICALEAARSLGADTRRAFTAIALPGARPAIAAGLSLALMEAAADYGAADFLGVQTLTVGLVRTWSSFGDAAAAARIAIVLIAIALAFQWIERRHRSGQGVQASSARWRAQVRDELHGPAAWLATAFCAGLLIWGFALPIGRLIWIAVEAQEIIAPVGEALRNSVLLGLMGAAAGLALAALVALGQRGSIAEVSARAAASAGYATPGAVLAVGALIVVSLTPLTLTGAAGVAILVWVYASRFTAAGAEPIQTALDRAPRSLGDAARSLGAGPVRKLKTVDLPVALPGALVGALILFVETLKELPATLMLRPFNWDTLAVRAYGYASDDRLAAAALPSVLITIAGLGPILILCWRLSRARPGHS
ncbi:MAG: iron ABC transporter permease [Pseudomonadota bacterium]